MDNNEDVIRDLSQPLFRAKGWMKLVAVMMIIYGVLTALSIVGILIAWLPIWIGVVLFQSASAIEEAHMNGRPEALEKSMLKLKTYFTITGVMTLVFLIIGIIGFIFGGMAGLAGMGQMGM